MKIYRLYEFLELEKSYPYKLIKKGYSGNFYEFNSDNDTYIVHVKTYETSEKVFEGILNYIKKKLPKSDYVKLAEISWSEKKNFYNSGNAPYSDRTSKTINLNELFKILNTVFKIYFEYMKENNIKYGIIGSCKKSKHKVYKQILEEEPNVKVIRVESKPWDNKRTVYNVLFEMS